MEVCPKLPVETCGLGTVYINPDPSATIKVSDLAVGGTENFDITNRHKAGTTAQPAAPNYQQCVVGCFPTQ